MSEVMTCMPFEQLMNWVLEEKKTKGTVFGQHRAYVAGDKKLNIFDRSLEDPIGPAAGPHTQLTQNIVASYYAGARFFELKTVQKMDGAELAACINRPCILADDEGYNCEWSTELYVPQAMGEYIKAWFILHVIAKEFGLGAQDGFQFNISVGYDLAGIKEPKVDTFINSMMEAKDTEIFKECRQWLLDNVDKFEKVTKEDIEAIPSAICNSATISTLHGCPPNEIESIANHLFKEKHLNTFIKCNPTLLGYEFARKTMDDMGYDYMVFGDFHFRDDLQYEDAIPMFKRLQALADELDLAFGVKITNTFPVDVTRNELPSEEMYMSGKSLFPLSISLAAKLSREFDGKLRIAYSGGADYYNIDRIVGCGVWPVTVATTLLKPGGYQRFTQMAEKIMADGVKNWEGIDVAALEQLAEDAKKDAHHVKNIKPLPKRKTDSEVPLLDCFFAPCEEGCPIHQDITTYVKLAGDGDYAQALRVILAVGANKPGTLKLEKGETLNALKFLRDFKATEGKVDLGKNVVVIGGGNTAMDTARAAKRTEGVEHVYLVYRRTKRYMPAAEDELLEVLEDGVEFKELLSPVSLENGKLLCKKMELGSMDASGRAGVTETGETEEVPADTVIVAVGEKVPVEFYEANGIAVNERGKARINDKTMETSVEGVYVAGDGAKGAATIVEAIRDAQIAVKAILGHDIVKGQPVPGTEEDCYSKKAVLKESKEAANESERCLTCNKVCENCVDVCPNRANISIKVPGMAMNQVIHVDYMCNECGNCKSFCPYASAPYKDKFTLFASEADMADSTNDGFAVINPETKECKVRLLGQISDCKAGDENDKLYEGLRRLICAVIDDYSYLLMK